MTKENAIDYMIKKVEEIERERLAENFSIDANKFKSEVVVSIIKALEEVEIEDENQQD